MKIRHYDVKFRRESKPPAELTVTVEADDATDAERCAALEILEQCGWEFWEARLISSQTLDGEE